MTDEALSYDELLDRSQSVDDVERVVKLAKLLNENDGGRIQNASIKIGSDGFADWEIWYDTEVECWKIAWIRPVVP